MRNWALLSTLTLALAPLAGCSGERAASAAPQEPPGGSPAVQAGAPAPTPQAPVDPPSAATTGVVEAEPYPADISPPPGTQYPCALTALPAELVGIPPAERAYINRTYTRVLRATQAKLVALRDLEPPGDGAAVNAGSAVATYEEATAPLLAAIRADAPPAGLEPFRDDLVAALELQRAFFAGAPKVLADGGGMRGVYALPEGRAASARLIAAWGRMTQRYPDWDQATRDSVYHHLCALDFF